MSEQSAEDFLAAFAALTDGIVQYHRAGSITVINTAAALPPHHVRIRLIFDREFRCGPGSPVFRLVVRSDCGLAIEEHPGVILDSGHLDFGGFGPWRYLDVRAGTALSLYLAPARFVSELGPLATQEAGFRLIPLEIPKLDARLTNRP